jgi:hypothetical protein
MADAPPPDRRAKWKAGSQRAAALGMIDGRFCSPKS